MPADRITYRVPGSTSNCGPGFDTLGIALNLHNRVHISPREDARIVYAGEGALIRNEGMGAVEEAARHFFECTGRERFGFSFDIEGDVPHSRGLGSSVTMRAGLLAGLNDLAGKPLTRFDLIREVSTLEGHPDNAVAAVAGGFCVARSCPESGALIDYERFPVGSGIEFVVVSPGMEIRTRDSRNALPANLPFSEVVKSVNSVAYLVSLFATGHYEKLRYGLTDFLHQPYREIRIPGARQAIDAGIDAGAYTGWLSGSGSSVLCFAPAAVSDRVGRAMMEAFDRSQVSARLYRLTADNEGLVREE